MNNPNPNLTPEIVWQRFLGAGIPGHQLKSLGYDLFFNRANPSGSDAIMAVHGLASALEVPPAYMYAALNIDPGRATLQQLASDYGPRLPWNQIAPSTRGYIERITQRLTIIKKAMQKPPGTGTQAPSPPSSQPAPTSRKPLLFTSLAIGIAGTIASYILRKVKQGRPPGLSLAMSR